MGALSPAGVGGVRGVGGVGSAGSLQQYAAGQGGNGAAAGQTASGAPGAALPAETNGDASKAATATAAPPMVAAQPPLGLNPLLYPNLMQMPALATANGSTAAGAQPATTATAPLPSMLANGAAINMAAAHAAHISQIGALHAAAELSTELTPLDDAGVGKGMTRGSFSSQLPQSLIQMLEGRRGSTLSTGNTSLAAVLEKPVRP